MRKRSRKLVSILLTLALLATLLVPMATPAVAGSKSISSLNVVTTKDDTTYTLGDLLITTVAGAVKEGHTITLRFPTDYKWDASLFSSTGTNRGVTVDGFVYATDGNYKDNGPLKDIFSIPDDYGNTPNGLAGGKWGVKLLTDNEMQIKLLDTAGMGNLTSADGYMYVYTKNIKIPAGASGDIKVVATAPGSQGLPSGEAVVGKIVGGEVYVSVDEVKTFTDTSSTITLRFKESVANSFDKTTNSMKLRLPNGFEWISAGTPTMIWGNPYWLARADVDVDGDGVADKVGGGNKGVYFDIQGRDLYIKADVKSGGGTYFSLPVRIMVADESVAKFGDVKVTFSGDTDAIPTELVVAKYNDLGCTVKAENTTKVTAGKTEQEIGDIVIEESAPASLADERTITFTLPSFAKWNKLPSIETEKGLTVSAVGFVGTDGRVLKYKVDSPSSGEPAKLKFKDAEIILSAEASGKVTVEVTGTAGAKGSVDVAEVVPAVTAKASAAPEVKIGLTGQTAGDLTITEGKAEAIASGKNLEIHLSAGEWNDVPTIEVTEGDIDLDEAAATTDGAVLIIPVKATSTGAATIKLSNIKIDLDRTVAEGDIYAKVKGLAVVESNDTDDDGALEVSGYTREAGPVWKLDVNGTPQKVFEGTPFLNATTAAKAAIAKVVTPAPAQEKKDVAFKIGSTKFNMNGVDVTMDVAPYIKDGRTYLPLRYVAQSLGVADANILWDQATKKVTLIKGTTFVQLTIGSNVMMVNGMPITMDVAPEISSDRTCLPIRFVAQVLGATVGWDEATQTVTIKM